MLRASLITIVIFALVLFQHCREPYDPAMENNVVSYLVVEGMINTDGVTTIQLSRTRRVSEKENRQVESGAVVEIESDNNNRYALADRGEGIYRSGFNALPKDRRYRLRIKTSAGREYLSTFAAVKLTPPVTVSWKQDSKGVLISGSSKDPTNQTIYYQWLTEETWEINSPLRSTFYIERTPAFRILQRTGQDRENAFQCWTNALSSNILTASTIAQSDDIVIGFPLVTILNGSDKLEVRYSILVSQYAISKEAYEFYEVMKKNTEQMGSVFDPQPSLVRGNVTSTTDPEETVIGFIDCSVASSSRIFITSQEAGNWKSSRVCQAKFVENDLTALRRELATDELGIVRAVYEFNPITGREALIGYDVANASCIDCRLRGTNVKPSFW